MRANSGTLLISGKLDSGTYQVKNIGIPRITLLDPLATTRNNPRIAEMYLLVSSIPLNQRDLLKLCYELNLD